MMDKSLYQFDAVLKKFLLAYLFTLTIGVLTGLIFLYYTTNYSPDTALERFEGSQLEEKQEDDFEIQEFYPKPVQELLITTHNHILGFAFILLGLGFVFYFNSIIKGTWKTILLVEPMISIVISFGSIWLMRFVDHSFVYLMAASSALIYLSFVLMAGVSAYELLFKKSQHE